MKIGVRLRLFLVSLVLIAICVATADVLVTRAVSGFVTVAIREDLLVRARLVAREAAVYPAPLSDVAAWDALADGQAVAAQARITLIRRDGVVIGDSEVEVAEIPLVENHGTRAEVVGALASGRGEESRMSVTVHERMMYVAVPFEQQQAITGIARVAKPLRKVDEAIGATRRLILAGSGIALVLAVLMSLFASQRLSIVVRDLTEAARRMTKGDLAVRTHVKGKDELAELGRALDHLASSLATTLHELRGERDLLGRVLESMQEGVLVVDAGGRVLTINPALRSMLLLPAESIGRPFIEVVRNATLHELLTRGQQTGSGGSGEIDLPGIKPRRLLVRGTPLSGDEERLLAVFVDVTNLRRLELIRRDFVANVSHELRTPVAAIRSAAETLGAGALDDPAAARRFVDMIERNSQRLQSLIDDLLELSRLDAKEFRLKTERVAVAPVASAVLGLFREGAERKGVRLRSDVPATLFSMGDARALEQVLSNLVENAIKYGGTGVVVSATEDAEEPERIRVNVTDTGPGIEAKHLPRLFERFYRVDAGRSRDVGGTGLGLSIVKHLVEAMGGTIQVESEVGKGSTFTLHLVRG